VRRAASGRPRPRAFISGRAWRGVLVSVQGRLSSLIVFIVRIFLSDCRGKRGRLPVPRGPRPSRPHVPLTLTARSRATYFFGIAASGFRGGGFRGGFGGGGFRGGFVGGGFRGAGFRGGFIGRPGFGPRFGFRNRFFFRNRFAFAAVPFAVGAGFYGASCWSWVPTAWGW
jgi:hypothetical protein